MCKRHLFRLTFGAFDATLSIRASAHAHLQSQPCATGHAMQWIFMDWQKGKRTDETDFGASDLPNAPLALRL